MVSKTLGHYEILEPLGKGGMGEVYRARDTKLNREVALKVLPSEMASNPDRVRRFEREAKAVAALDHPNIVTIYSIEEADGLNFITMGLVKGRVLSELIPRRGLPLDRIFAYAIPAADAISSAHEAGITHRDIKPTNIMVTGDGRVKILDFGLAKLRQEGASPDLVTTQSTDSLTEEGVVVGTVAYMSPEQAEGKPVDHRTDIFSLGVVVYEMASGKRPFGGETKASLISSILRDVQPSVAEVKPSLPRHLGRIVDLALEKDPERRFQSAKDLRNQLALLKEEVDSGKLEVSASGQPLAAERGRTRRWIAAAVLGAAVLGLGYTLFETGRRLAESRRPPSVSSHQQLTYESGAESWISLSPDGDEFVYSSAVEGDWNIYRQRVEGRNAVNLTANSAADNYMPAFSPDGRRIAFVSNREGPDRSATGIGAGAVIYLMGATGEGQRRLAGRGFNPAWSPDGTEIVYSTTMVGSPDRFTSEPGELWAVDVDTEQTRLVFGGDAVQPDWSPSGERIAYWALHDDGNRDVWTISASGGDPVQVTTHPGVDWNPVWAPDGEHLCFLSDRSGIMSLWWVRIDERSGEVLADPEPLAATPIDGFPSLSADGLTIAYIAQEIRANLQALGLDPMGEKTSGDPVWITQGSRMLRQPAVSPDGQLIAMISREPDQELAVIRIDGTGFRRLTNDRFNDRDPQWSADAATILYLSDRSGSVEVWQINADGGGAVPLTDTPGQIINSFVVSRDGSRLAYSTDPGSTPFVQEIGSGETGRLLPVVGDEPVSFRLSSWSADGDLIAGNIIGESGTLGEMAVYSFATSDYTALGVAGYFPQWLGDSHRLVFSDYGRILLLADLFSPPRPIFSFAENEAVDFTISPDGSAIFFSRGTLEADVWLLELR